MDSVLNLVRLWVRPAAMTTLWLWFTLAALAQGVVPDATLGDALRSLSARADVVFVGRVTTIRQEAAVAGSAGSVAIDFRVEQTLAGPASGTYTLHEWGGLWPPGQHRYFPGEHVAIFLHASSRAALSSPVDGMEGVLPIVQQDALSEPLVDLSRVATRLLRAHNEPLAASGSGMKLSELNAFVTHSSSSREPALYPLPSGAVVPASGPQKPAGPQEPDLWRVLQKHPEGDASKLHALLQPIDPEREAVGESRWGGQ